MVRCGALVCVLFSREMNGMGDGQRQTALSLGDDEEEIHYTPSLPLPALVGIITSSSPSLGGRPEGVWHLALRPSNHHTHTHCFFPSHTHTHTNFIAPLNTHTHTVSFLHTHTHTLTNFLGPLNTHTHKHYWCAPPKESEIVKREPPVSEADGGAAALRDV